MPKQIIIAEEHRLAAVFAEDQIQELIVATGTHQVGDIYLGVVENVLPGIDAAFVNLGDASRNGFIHVTDLGPLRLKRTAGAITELLAPQQKVLVQVMKEPTGTKGPRLTGNISLPGRYLVLMPYGRGVNLSRRITNEAERHRLRALGILVKPAGMGLLVRTEAEGVSEEAILEDLELLQRQWETIQQQAASSRPPQLLGRDDDFIQKVLRDVYSSDVNRIVVDTPDGVKRVKQHLKNWNVNKPVGVLIDYHQEPIPILDYFRVNAAIREALKPRVDLPSGGYIIIQPTEALTVIDVNSGSFTSSATSRETVLWTNCEAATEIARQLRLRNIAGVIIVDFIDMDSRRDQLQLLEHFSKALRADKARPQIAQLSELGLVELTRKRQGQNIYELFGRPCSACGGLGHLVHLPGEPEDSPGEIVERSPMPRPPEPRRSLESRTEPNGFASSSLETQLINHPDYQAVGGIRPRASRSSHPPAPRSPRRASENGNGRKVITMPTETAPPPVVKVESRPPRPARPSRSEPAEVITVTMTDQEQAVYAEMGISPLVLHSEEVKNPRGTIVMVARPGQDPLPLPQKTARPVSEGMPEDIPETADEPPSSVVSTINVEPIAATTLLNTSESEVTTESESGGEASTPEASVPAGRRRRRRVTTSEQLSLDANT
ncbi:Rne/Rng family ribonuclease [Thermosynechococcus sp. CL-1]|uniref:Rne/Rng family ribonuclease n=1 Tax=Thermosynechococcus sp. CL-1 TaxID=2583530 RepID=UPI00122E4E20|nr:Rne/Rng family ribonuclease [Thermosynechococcus sp. CL-1]QEQ02200.1 Rne/Rng family ribonuclease [Thermosynechococcus sp. CL-1]